MPRPAHQRAPKVYRLIQRINEILLQKQMTREDFREVLNEYLAPYRKLPRNHNGLIQVTRWLDLNGQQWSEPMGEIVIAMQNYVDDN